VREAGPGEMVAKLRGTPHVAPLLGAAGPPDVAALGALQARYAMTMDLG
jgi:hypothetical protein